MKRATAVSTDGQRFLINGRPTYEGVSYRGKKVEGLLMNSRMVQAVFDDLNPETRPQWSSPDEPWDPERNTREFVAAMPAWRASGLLSFTVNLQGGNPRGYGRNQPWHNSAFDADGGLRPEYLARLERVLDRADELGMAPIVGYFYFGQDERLADEAAVVRGTENATDWLLAKGYRNVLVEICNEADIPLYDHPILRADRCHELVELVQRRSAGALATPAGRLLAGVSVGGGSIPLDAVIAASDFLLLHGNGVREPGRIRSMVEACRGRPAYRGQPVLFNEDDHFDFEKPENNMLAAVAAYAGWGYFDYRMAGEGFHDGYQSVPVDWSVGSGRKRGFFDLLSKVTGYAKEQECAV